MNILKILDKISSDNFFSGENTRAEALTQLGNFGKKTALAAVPVGLASFMATDAKAESNLITSTSSLAAAPADVVSVLQFALLLEYLEDEFYRTGLNALSGNLIPTADKAVFNQISKHETSHVTLLKGAITTKGFTPDTKPSFDFTAGGTFPDVFTNYQTFMTLAQAFEDTGVRAYKGQAGAVAEDKAILTVALQIHSVEARHASQVRRMRMQKGWIEGSVGGNIPAAASASYTGEGITTQAGFNTATKFGAAAGSASFDEPLTKAEVTAIATMFLD